MRKSFVLALITLIPLSASADQFSILSDSYIATSRRALRTSSSKPPADCTISGATSPSRHGSRRHEPRNRNRKTPRRLTRLFAIRSSNLVETECGLPFTLRRRELDFLSLLFQIHIRSLHGFPCLEPILTARCLESLPSQLDTP